MPCKRFTNEQVALVLRETEIGATVDEVGRVKVNLPMPRRRTRTFHAD